MTDLTIRRDPRHGNQYYIAGYHGTFFSTEADAWAAFRLMCDREAELAVQGRLAPPSYGMTGR